MPSTMKPGTTRQVANRAGESIGIEVWTEAGWVALLGVLWVSPCNMPMTPAIGPAHLTLRAVLPAALPWPKRAA